MRVLVPLPDRDFDTTEVAVPWRLLSDRGHEIVSGNNAIPLLNEIQKQIEHLWFGRNGLTAASQFALSCVQNVIAEREAHGISQGVSLAGG